MKKKALSLIIVFCMILGMVPSVAMAADQTSSDAGVRIQYVENSYDQETGIFKVNVQAKHPNGVGISSLGVVLSFDNTKLTLINQNNGNDLPGSEGNMQAPKAAAIKILLADEDEFGSPISYSFANVIIALSHHSPRCRKQPQHGRAWGKAGQAKSGG